MIKNSPRSNIVTDIRGLNRTDLKERYKSEYNSHRNAKRRGKTNRQRAFDDRLSDFRVFLFVLGSKPDTSYTLDRIDNDLGYTFGNLRWATKREQSNNRSCTKYVTFPNGNRYPLTEAAEILKISPNTLHSRIRRGATTESVVASTQARYLPTNDDIFRLWKTLVETEHSIIVIDRPKERKLLKDLSVALRKCGISPELKLEEIVLNWSDFTEYASSYFAAYGMPRFPTLTSVSKNLNAVANYTPTVSHPLSSLQNLTVDNPARQRPLDLLIQNTSYLKLLKIFEIYFLEFSAECWFAQDRFEMKLFDSEFAALNSPRGKWKQCRNELNAALVAMERQMNCKATLGQTSKLRRLATSKGLTNDIELIDITVIQSFKEWVSFLKAEAKVSSFLP